MRVIGRHSGIHAYTKAGHVVQAFLVTAAVAVAVAVAVAAYSSPLSPAASISNRGINVHAPKVRVPFLAL